MRVLEKSLINGFYYRLTGEEIASNLTKMCLKTVLQPNGELEVEIPPTRHDVIHACDIYEDIAISYG